jgi:hypothetical protein
MYINRHLLSFYPIKSIATLSHETNNNKQRHSPAWSCMVIDNNNNSAVVAAMYLTSSKPSLASTTLLSASTPSLDDNLDNNRDQCAWYDTTVTEMTGGGTLELVQLS